MSSTIHELRNVILNLIQDPDPRFREDDNAMGCILASDKVKLEGLK